MGKITALLLICLIGFVSQASNAIAQPPTSDAPRVSIIYPPVYPNRYENSSLMLEVNVQLFEGSPRPGNFSFSLDGKQPVNFENISTSRLTYWQPYVYTIYKARFSLENLSEGNHTVAVYADGLVDSRAFRVNSFYHPTVVEILSPTNQAYSSRVPLVFTVNMPVQGAYYYMYRGYDAVFENHFNSNITMDGLLIGNYTLHLYVTTENGVDSASTSFSVINNDSLDLSQVGVAIIVVVFVVCIIFLLLYVRHVKKNTSRLNFEDYGSH